MSLESPISVLFDTNGIELAVTASQSSSFIAGNAPGLLVMGSSSVGAQFLRLTNAGDLVVTGTVVASFTPNTPVSQGNAGSIPQSWYMRITDGTQVLGTGSSAPLWVSGTVTVNNVVSVTGTVGVTSIASPVTVNVTSTLDVRVIGTASITGTVGVTSIASPVTVRMIDGTTSVVTGFGASTTNVTVLASNTNRTAATFYMDGGATAYIKLGSGANPTGSNGWTVKLLNNGYFELPDQYTGQVDAIFSATDATKILRITEISE